MILLMSSKYGWQYTFVIFVLHALSYQTATRFNSVCVCVCVCVCGGGGGGGGGGGSMCYICRIIHVINK